jgi:hypothetical protein
MKLMEWLKTQQANEAACPPVYFTDSQTGVDVTLHASDWRRPWIQALLSYLAMDVEVIDVQGNEFPDVEIDLLDYVHRNFNPVMCEQLKQEKWIKRCGMSYVNEDGSLDEPGLTYLIGSMLLEENSEVVYEFMHLLSGSTD